MRLTEPAESGELHAESTHRYHSRSEQIRLLAKAGTSDLRVLRSLQAAESANRCIPHADMFLMCLEHPRSHLQSCARTRRGQKPEARHESAENELDELLLFCVTSGLTRRGWVRLRCASRIAALHDDLRSAYRLSPG